MSDRDDDNTPTQAADQDQSRRDSLFSDFEDTNEFEDSDRDSDFAAIYTEVDDEEPEFGDEDLAWELEEEDPDGKTGAANRDPWGESADTGREEPDLWEASPNPPGAFDDEPPEAEDALPLAATASTAGDSDDWEAFEDEEYEEEERRELSISPGMIVVALIALGLLVAGGYGVIDQRAGMQEEIRELQAKLGTAAAPSEVTASRQAAEQAAERNTLLEQQVAELRRENRSLQAIVTGLEKQLTAQQEAINEATPAAKPAPEPVARPAPASSSAPAAAGSWFVNFSSYSQRSTAESWASKLHPGKGRVIVASGDSNGRTIYRVRVVDLPDKAAAEAIARRLEADYGLARLWVGQSG
ncbi:SPOR domain-containing protein [Seongchinamella sediminis]|nr:SPOR domain-containing protein [Seongchinamella sediminis]